MLSGHVRVCCWLYVSRASYGRVQATVRVGTVLIWYFRIAYKRGGGGVNTNFQHGSKANAQREWETRLCNTTGPMGDDDGAQETGLPESKFPKSHGAP